MGDSLYCFFFLVPLTILFFRPELSGSVHVKCVSKFFSRQGRGYVTSYIQQLDAQSS